MPVEAHPGVAREDLADRFAGRYLETGSDSTALAGSLAGGGERSEHPTSVGGKRAGRTDPPGASAARGSKRSEERRVGKEGRSRGRTEQEKEKEEDTEQARVQ